jgi:hypothetical protein
MLAAEDESVTVLEIVAAVLLVTGSALLLRAIIAADAAFEKIDPALLKRREADAVSRLRRAA